MAKEEEQVKKEDTEPKVTPEDQDQNDTPAADEKASERKLAKQESALKSQLKKMKKVKLTIPEDPLNPDDVVPVGWNGIIYAIPRGIEVEVPEVIAEIWRESYQKTQEVNKRIRESTKKELKIL
ncbi:hypothetical protein FHR92_005244 [Fontibacillus solani]|uniref:Uncharacterized protein n=1 Tax=Fontibacillus solani TaxID=1572857 RepID=A0A7W3SYS5_9BACL|nr:hypothetical protein [Fontibacillus solani]MBA9088726.1 hypothetical protein [Fontibacillus solani]